MQAVREYIAFFPLSRTAPAWNKKKPFRIPEIERFQWLDRDFRKNREFTNPLPLFLLPSLDWRKEMDHGHDSIWR
jgi:hypothetical protein